MQFLWRGNGVLEFVVDKLTSPAGRMWLQMLTLIVIPLVFALLTLGALKKLGRMEVSCIQRPLNVDSYVGGMLEV